MSKTKFQPTKWYSREEKQRELNRVLSDTISYFERNIFPEAIEIIKYKNWDMSDRAMMLYKLYKDDWEMRSNQNYPLLQHMLDVFVANLYDTDTRAKAIAMQEEFQDDAEMAQDFYDWASNMSNSDEEKEIILSEAVLLWTSYSKASFDVESKETWYVTWWDYKSLWVIKKFNPILEHINYFNVFYPPETKDFYKAKWIAYRYITTVSDANSRYKNLWVSLSDNVIKSSPISSWDYSRVYDCKSIWDWVVNRVCSKDPSIDTTQYDFLRREMFYIKSKENNIVEVVEYWEWDNLTVLINGWIIYDWASPYPDRPPFMLVAYEKQPWSCRWRWIGQKLIALQKEANLVHNWIKDSINMWLFPMMLAQRWAVIDRDGNTPEVLYWRPSAVIETTLPWQNWWIEPMRFSDPQYITLGRNHLEFIIAQSYEIAWVNSYVSWWQTKVERSWAWVTQRVAAMRSRLQPIINSLNRLDAELFRQRLAMATVFMDDEFKVMVVWDDWTNNWKSIKISNILNKFTVVAENEANRAATKMMRATQSLDALTKINSINMDPITQLPYYDITPAIQHVVENYDFQALKKFTPDDLKIKLEEKAKYDEILWINKEQQAIETNTQQLPQQTANIPTAWISEDLLWSL